MEYPERRNGLGLQKMITGSASDLMRLSNAGLRLIRRGGPIIGIAENSDNAAHYRRTGEIRQDTVIAVAASLILHGLPLLCLLSTCASSLKGNAGVSEGTADKGDGIPALAIQILTAPQVKADEPAEETPQDTSVGEGASEMEPLISETLVSGGAHSPETIRASVSYPEAALSNSEENPLGGAPSGVVDGNLTLLQQIARCLPPNVRPNLSPAHVKLAVTKDGTLSGVPVLTVDVSKLSRDQLREANQIIQASLQCGPYTVGGDQSLSEIDVPANFAVVGNPAS